MKNENKKVLRRFYDFFFIPMRDFGLIEKLKYDICLEHVLSDSFYCLGKILSQKIDQWGLDSKL